MKTITVFCGSSAGTDDKFAALAALLGRTLALMGARVAYGGARVGLMGALADGALAAGGEVVGVLPRFLQAKELAHQGLTELIIVESMHERKTVMHDLCDGIIALPGGFGTMEELFETLTWAQLGLHAKPTGILNIDGFYDPLAELLETMTAKGFLKEIHRDALLIADNIEDLLLVMERYKAPPLEKWISKQTL